MTYSTSPELCRLSGVLLAALLGLACLTERTISRSEPAVELAVQSQVVTKLQLKPNSRPRWAQFSPANPNLILLDVDGKGIVASLPAGSIRNIPHGMLPVGWLGSAVVVRDQSGRFRLLNAVDLSPAKAVTVGAVSLPWPLGKNRRLWLDVDLPETASSNRPPVSGAETKQPPLISREETSLAIDPGDDGRNVRDAGGKIIFEGSKKVYGATLSPDAYKLVVYYGNTDYVLFNRLTGRTTKMPATIEEWTWLPDSSTLIGQVNTSAGGGAEEVTRTELHIFDPMNQNLEPIKLPSEIQGAALKILDVSITGQVLVEAERVIPKSAYLGVMVFEIKQNNKK